MMIISFFRAWGVLSHSATWKTIGLALLVTSGIFSLLWLGLDFGIVWLGDTILPLLSKGLEDIGLIDSGLGDSGAADASTTDSFSAFISAPLLIMLLWLLFPGVFMAAVSLFLERIVSSLELKAYPSLPDPLPVGFTQSLKDSSRLLGLILVCNGLMAPLYLVLPIGGGILYLLVNGYLISQEHLRLIAARRIGAPNHITFAKTHWLQGTIVGTCMTTFMLLPFINLVAAIVTVAWMTHLFHGLSKTAQD